MPLLQRLLALCFLVLAQNSFSQNTTPPFADEIRTFDQQDAHHKPAPGAVLFVGSSSIRLWSGLQSDFPRHRVLNRGFGGASIPDVARYAEQTIYRYKPSQIVFYCGENDLAASDTITVATVVTRFTSLFRAIRKQLPGVPFVFISIKPSPSRAHIQHKVVAANQQIKQFLARQKATRFVDVYQPMMGADARPRGELFRADSLHMTEKGYAIWKEKLEPVLGR